MFIQQYRTIQQFKLIITHRVRKTPLKFPPHFQLVFSGFLGDFAVIFDSKKDIIVVTHRGTFRVISSVQK